MIGFACNACGSRMLVNESAAGTTITCSSCKRETTVPPRSTRPSVVIEPGPSLLGPSRPSVPTPPGRFTVAEGTCRMWKKGGLANQKADHQLLNMGLDGLTVRYGAKKLPGTIATAPSKPPWAPGTELDVAVSVGAFAMPLRFAAELASVEDAGGLGCTVELKITALDEKTRERLTTLSEHEDLRQRSKTRLLGA
jgi:hypothetical protein